MAYAKFSAYSIKFTLLIQIVYYAQNVDGGT